MAFITGTSRFRKTPLIKTRDGKDTYGRVVGFDALRNLNIEDFTWYTVQSQFNGRPDLIAANNYGDPQLEWVLVLANKPFNTINWPATGERIKIPRNTFIRGLL